MPPVVCLHEHAQDRPPNWRWELARLLRGSDRSLAVRLNKRADEATRRLKKFQEEESRVRTQCQSLDLQERWPTLSEAFYLHNSSNKYTRWELEARLLTLDTYDEIAARLRLRDPGIVAWYEKAFFSVRDRLDSHGWVSHVIIGELLQTGLTERKPDILWKLYGYAGGGAVLDLVIDHVHRNKTSSKDVQSATAFFKDDMKQTMAVKASIAAKTLKLDNTSGPIVLEVAAKFEEIEQIALNASGAGSGGLGASLAENLKAFLAGLRWGNGTQAFWVDPATPGKAVGDIDSRLLMIDNARAELRSEELLRLEYEGFDGEAGNILQEVGHLQQPRPGKVDEDGEASTSQ